jgi:hypothetical protein
MEDHLDVAMWIAMWESALNIRRRGPSAETSAPLRTKTAYRPRGYRRLYPPGGTALSGM